MTRFIIITFALLGWAFYEMSGGADFEPTNTRLSTIKTDPLKPAGAQQPLDVAAAPELNDPAKQTDVTRVSLNLADTDEVAANFGKRRVTLPQQDPAPTQQIAIAAPAQGDSVAIIPSLVAGVDPAPEPEVVQVVATQSAPVALDIRTVTGNRVNVRGGPSTDFNVVNQMLRGDEVEILEDNGNGWVRLRPLDGGPEGWMADFLLASS